MSRAARRTFGVSALLVALIGSCANQSGGNDKSLTTKAATSTAVLPLTPSEHPMPQEPDRAAPPVPQIDTDAVFKSLPAPTVENAAPYQFKELRTPARPNEEAIPFPPPTEVQRPVAPHVSSGPLEVSRHQPEGPQEIVGTVNATFNQPMVPLASLADLKGHPVPLEIEPLPPGRFRWLGTSTVEFEPEGRMPFSTQYTARVPVTARSAEGRTLGRATEWSFETPRTTVTFNPPDGFREAVPNQLVQLTFNQTVAAAAVRKALKCTANGKAFDIVEAQPEADPFKDSKAADLEMQRKLFAERNVFIRPAKPLPLDAAIVCTLPAGFQSAEGPLPTKAAQSVKFNTYPLLRLMEFKCGWGDQCRVEAGIVIQFNNTIEPDQELSNLVHVDPAVEELHVEPNGPYLMVQGGFLPSTTYKIRVDAAIRDVHKQSLGHEEKGEIKFEPSPPELSLGGAPHAILEANGPRVIPIHSTNVKEGKVRWFRVEPKDLAASIELTQRYWQQGSDPFAKLTAAATSTLSLGKHDNKAEAAGISVDGVTGAGKPGLFILDIESPELGKVYNRAPTHRSMVVQVTDLGVTAHLTDDTAIVLVTSLATGRPVPGARASLIKADGGEFSSGETDARGIAELKGPGTNVRFRFSILASHGADRAVLPIGDFKTGDYISSYQSGDVHDHKPTVVASAFTDRQPYRPGESVHVAGVVRVATHGVRGRVEPLPEGAQLIYVVTDERGAKTHKGKVAIGALGMFSVDLKIAADATLGNNNFTGTLTGAGGFTGQTVGTNFQIQEYRTPEYKVSIEPGDDPHFVGDTLHGKVRGEYYFGGPMSGAQVNWSISRSKGSFTPPGADGFIFGELPNPEPWRDWGRSSRFHPVQNNVAQGAGTIDATGTLAFDTRLDPDALKGAVSFQIEATVTDANRQTISSSSTVLAHAGALYPGLKIDRSVAKEGESVVVSAITADIDGKRHDPPTSVELAERKWERVKKGSVWSYEEKETPVEGCTLTWSHKLDEASACRVKLPKAGNFVLRVRTKDDRGRENVSATTVWAYGKGWSPWFQRNEGASVELVADKPEHAPGETASILIRSPFPRSVGILAIQREGLVEYRALDFEGAAHGEGITLTEAEVPNVTLMVSLVRGRISPSEAGALEDDADDAGRPMYAGGTIVLPISKQSHVLKVAVTAAKPQIEPGSKLDLQIKTTTNDGQPHAARLAVAVVDEGVLSLLGYSIPNPLTQIFADRPAEGGAVSAVPLVLQREQKLRLAQGGAAAAGAAPLMMRAKSMEGDARAGATMDFYSGSTVRKAPMAAEAAPPTMTARTFFASTAYFNADVRTDAQGHVSLSVPMPENLTRYRIMVVAVGDGERFGSGDGSVQVRKPLLVRPSLPRFLNLGDKFLASAVVNNQTENDLWVDAQARADNGAADAKRQRVLVRAGQATEVAFEATAGVPGNSRWQFAAVALTPERWNDAAELDVPIKLPATVEAFATYGVTDKSVLQPVQLPKDALPDFGGLEVSMSSTALTGLSDAVTYLHEYPYECVEQTASRVLPLIVLRKIIGDFHLKGAGTDAERDKLIKDGLERIWAKQRDDGGFGYWSDSRDSYLYVSSWAAYVFSQARKAGYTSGNNYQELRLVTFLQQRLASPRHDLGEDKDFNSQAMAALVLAGRGVSVGDQVKRIFGNRTGLAIFGKAWLMEAARLSLGQGSEEEKELNRALQSAAVQKASSAHFTEATSESIRLIMHSNERTDAIVLASLIHVTPSDPLIPKIIHGLNESRTHGRWDTTQSNAWATVAMSDYYETFEKETPNFDANIFVGNGFVGQGKFAGRETKILTEQVPFPAMVKQTNSDLTLEKVGTGRLYYRLGLRYAPKDLKLGPGEQGFTVTRTYLEMPDAPGSVTTDADGTVHIRAGTEVRVQLQVVVSDRASFVAVDDPLPAGLEAVNTAFLTSQTSRVQDAQGTDVARSGWWGWWSPFNHTELKDDRVALFADQLSAGVYTHTYVARATTKGTFQVPPARAFEMYEPENFGRTGSLVVVVQ